MGVDLANHLVDPLVLSARILLREMIHEPI